MELYIHTFLPHCRLWGCIIHQRCRHAGAAGWCASNNLILDYKHKHFYHTVWVISLKKKIKWNPFPNAQTWTDVRVGAVQLGQAGSFQQLLPLRDGLRSGRFHQRCHVSQRKSAGRPPAHVGTEVICTDPHNKEHQSGKGGEKLKMNLNYLLIWAVAFICFSQVLVF